MKKWWFLVSLFLIIPFLIAAVCSDGQTQSCGTSSLGACRLGSQSCVNGAWSFCQGAMYPSAEVCFDEVDNDCDGVVDQGCECVSGMQESCGSSDKGVCKLGTRSCVTNHWSACEGAVLPLPTEVCHDSLDNNCNGKVDEGCVVASCFDKVKNQDESAVDCGGACQACQSCFDSIKNQDEVQVDCGGSCSACPSCDDGRQNGGELGVDCGGSCVNACVIDEDGDTLLAEQEELLGTSPLFADSDHDSVNDNLDVLPLCPNSFCDVNYGESSENCPGDCPKERSLNWWYVLGVVLLIILAFWFLVHRLSRPVSKGGRSEVKKESGPVLVELSDRAKKEKKSVTEDALEKSFARAEQFLKK